jgi:hypothetical protein
MPAGLNSRSVRRGVAPANGSCIGDLHRDKTGAAVSFCIQTSRRLERDALRFSDIMARPPERLANSAAFPLSSVWSFQTPDVAIQIACFRASIACIAE